jgi:hypothetical protein
MARVTADPASLVLAGWCKMIHKRGRSLAPTHPSLSLSWAAAIQSRSAANTTTSATAPSPKNKSFIAQPAPDSPGSTAIQTDWGGDTRQTIKLNSLCPNRPPVFPSCLHHFSRQSGIQTTLGGDKRRRAVMKLQRRLLLAEGSPEPWLGVKPLPYDRQTLAGWR